MTTVKQAYEAFMSDCETSRRTSTVATYRTSLTPFVDLFGDQALETITIGMIRNYAIDLRNRPDRWVGRKQRAKGGLSVYTLRKYLRGLKTFFGFCATEYKIENPAKALRLPGQPKNPPKAIAINDLKLLFEVCDQSLEGIRNRALLAFLCDTGCRAGGLLGLRLIDLDLIQRRATVTEKGDRTRVVPFSPITADLIRVWLSVKPEGQAVFCSVARFRGRALTITGLERVMERLKAKSGVKGRVNPHSFRHGFAREFLRNGGDIATLSQILGHASSGVTIDFYSRFNVDELGEAHDRVQPMKGVLQNV